MNCKPGDLAVIVTTLDWRPADNLLGRIVRVTRCELNIRDEPAWHYEGERLRNALGKKAQGIPDAWLRPIDGDGITDKEVDELYSAPSLPVKEQA